MSHPNPSCMCACTLAEVAVSHPRPACIRACMQPAVAISHQPLHAYAHVHAGSSGRVAARPDVTPPHTIPAQRDMSLTKALRFVNNEALKDDSVGQIVQAWKNVFRCGDT